MNQNNFFKLFEDIDIDNMSLSDEELKRIYDIEIKKSGLNKKKKFANKKLKVFLIAAVLVIITITGFTKYKSIVEMFEGIVKGQNDEVMEKSGNTIGQTITNNNLKIILNGIIGDESQYYIILDVEDITGRVLKAVDYNGTPLDGNLSFNECFFGTIEDEEGISPSSVKYIDEDKTDNKAKFLIDGSTWSNLIGKTGVLKLTNLVEKVNGTGTDIVMHADNIYDIYMMFKSEYDVEQVRGLQERELRTDGSIINELPMVIQRMRFSYEPKTRNMFINNMMFENGILYLNLESFSLKQFEQFDKFKNCALKNINTGELINSTHNSSEFDIFEKMGRMKLEFDFGKEFSVEELKNYTLVIDVGEIYAPVVEGEWNFEFPITYENKTKIYDLDKEIKIKEYPIKITTAKVSSLSIEVGGYIMKKMEDIKDMNGELENEINKTKLIMKDDTIIDIKNNGNSFSPNSGGENLIINGDKIDAPIFNPILSFSYKSDTIIDIDEIRAIQIGDNIIELN